MLIKSNISFGKYPIICNKMISDPTEVPAKFFILVSMFKSDKAFRAPR